MNVEQTNLWENVNRSGNRMMAKGVAAYQANMPESSILDVHREKYEKMAGVTASGNINMADATYQNPLRREEEEKTLAEQIESKQDMSAMGRMNEMAVVVNTTSAEDFKKVEEAGFSVMESDSRTIITVTDKIKAVLAQAGVDISIYGDSLSREQLQEITGSALVTNQIMQILDGNDLPTTEANVEDCVLALEEAAGLTQVGEDAISYLLKNELEPTIRNVYTAEHSSVENTAADEYVPTIDFDAMEEQIAAIITEAGLEVNESTLVDSKWLIAHQIPLTSENLVYLGQLKNLSGELEAGTYNWTELIDSMAKAITNGQRPEDGLMITARRKLEETRLVMTAEASNAMQKVGMQIDTRALEDLVEGLKEQEKQYYHNLLSSEGVDAGDENVDTFMATTRVFEELKTQPAYTLGTVTNESTVEQIHSAGELMRQSLAHANERYETLQTAPRKDMGDSIQKAFQNVDDILTDLRLDTSENNRRAVRILAYNNTPITEENIYKVKALDENMQRAFHNMTPKVTLEMIRRGMNPLDMTLEELNLVTETLQKETGSQGQERFSKFLWRLEQNHEISEDERSSYIGIYRLIAQVERTDGAAIGSLMNQDTEVTMRNLLTAMRSAKKSGMDYAVDDDFGSVQGKTAEPKIDEQIEAAFQQNCLKDVLDRATPEKLARIGSKNWENMTPEQLAEQLREMEDSKEETAADQAYVKEQLAAYKQVMDSSKDLYTYLERYDIANSMTNLMAASNMLRKPNQVMERLWKNGILSEDSMTMIESLKEQVLQEFGESLENPEALADAQEKLADVAEHVMDTMIMEDPSTRSLDVRDLRQMTSMFQLCAKKAREESYMVPVQTGDSVTGVSLKIVRGKEKKGIVDILFENHRIGKVAASFQAKDQGISGMIAVNDEKTKELFTEHLGLLAAAIQKGNTEPEAVDINVAYVSDLSLEHYEMTGLRREEKLRAAGELSEDRSNPVQTKHLYHIAESFIQSMQKLVNS